MKREAVVVGLLSAGSGGEVVGAVDGIVIVGAQDDAVLHAEHQAPPLLQQMDRVSSS